MLIPKAIDEDRLIVWLDEKIFLVRGTGPAYSLPNTNIKVTDKCKYFNVYLIAGITEKGILSYDIFQNYIDTKMYVKFLKSIAKKLNYKKKVSVFYDGLSVHLT